MTAICPDLQCIWKDGIVAKVLWTYLLTRGDFFIILLLQLWLVGFGSIIVSIRVMVKFNFFI